MIRTLSSIRLTFVLLIIVALLMGAGIVLVIFDEYKKAIKLMSEVVVYGFFKDNWQNNIVLTIWVASICVASALLFLNTAFCSITQQLKTALKISTLRKWSFFVIHITFLIVLACHGITMVSGSKISGIELFEGDAYTFNNDMEIKVVKIKFLDNADYLKLGAKESRALMTRELFHRDKNFAEISILKDNKEVAAGKIFMLSPLKYKSIRVTMTQFCYNNKDGKDTIGANLTITENIFTEFFLAVYVIMIITLICFIVITWKPQKSAGVIVS